MKRFGCKVLLLLGGMFVLGGTAQAQYLRSSYFMEGTSARLQLNPGLQPTRGYFNIPVIGSLNVSASSNVLGTSDIIDVLDSKNSLYSNDKLFDKLLQSDNRLNVNLNTDILSFGWYRGKGFWTFNVGLRTDIGASLAKDMFSMMRNMKGFALEDKAGTTANYDLSNQSVNVKAYAEVGLGYSRRITEKLTVGARVKVLLGLARASFGRRAGMFSYLGTTDFRVVCAKVVEGDPKAVEAYQALVYQLAKDIGAMAAVLHFDVDAIVYTAGMAYEDFFCDDITAYVGKIAPIIRLPGEEEMRSLAEGALRVLRGQQEAGQY